MGALDFICRSILNAYLLPFFEAYCNEFPELKHPREVLYNLLLKVVEREKADTSSIVDIPSSQSEDEEKKKMKEVKETTAIAEMFIKSFRPPFAERLKKSDETLLDEKEACEFLRHLQLKKVWKTKMTPHQKKNTWHYLNGAYLILEMFVLLPPLILSQLETIITEHFNQVVRLKREFQKDKFKEDLKVVIHTLKDEEMKQIAMFFWEFITSQHTPVYALIDEKFHDKIHILLSTVKSEQGRKFLMSQMGPFVDSLKKKAGDVALEFDGTTVKYAEELKVETEEVLAKRKATKEKLLFGIIDALGEVLGDNKDLVNQLIEEPSKGMSILMTNLIPAFLGMAKLQKTGDTEEEKAQAAALDAELFGPATTVPAVATQQEEKKRTPTVVPPTGKTFNRSY